MRNEILRALRLNNIYVTNINCKRNEEYLNKDLTMNHNIKIKVERTPDRNIMYFFTNCYISFTPEPGPFNIEIEIVAIYKAVDADLVNSCSDDEIINAVQFRVLSELSLSVAFISKSMGLAPIIIPPMFENPNE